MTDTNPEISILMITYNHESYIVEAINGVLFQKTDFTYELIIANDCSTDNTDEKIREYLNGHQKANQVTYFSHKKNMGSSANFEFGLKQCTGNYIAFCDGDDYWTDPFKLQKQVAFLKMNKNYVMSFHSVDIKNEVKGLNYEYPVPPKLTLGFRDLFFNHYIPTCSLLFKRETMPATLPPWYWNCKIGDISLELMIANHGLTKYFPEKMAVYRKHEGGVTRNIEQIKNGRHAYLYMYKNLNIYLNYKYWLLFSIIIFKIRLGFVKDKLGLNPLLKR